MKYCFKRMADSEDEGYFSDDSGSNVPLANRKVKCYCTKCNRFTGCKGQPGCTCSCPDCVLKEIAAGAGAGAAAESGSH